MGEYPGSETPRDRVGRAEERLIAAHRRAILIHAAAARVFDARGDAARAADCGHRAQTARNKLAVALWKQRQTGKVGA